MASVYELSQQKLKGSGSSGGLKADFINGRAGGTLATARIDPNAARINFNPANIPKEVKDQTSAGIQHFMGTTAEAAFRYQDRESTLFAKQSILETQALFNVKLNGTQDELGKAVPGYMATKGGNASTAFDPFKSDLNEIAESQLNKLEPRVREKATIQIMDAKNEATAIASKHRVKQLEVAEEAVRYTQLKVLASKAGEDYRNIFTLDQHGKNYKNRVYEMFDDPQQADEAWYDLLQGTVTNIVNKAPTVDAGLQVANDVFASTIGPELKGDLDKYNETQSYLHSTKRANERFKWAEQQQARANADRADEARWANNEDELDLATLETGVPLTPMELEMREQHDEVSEGWAAAYRRENHGEMYYYDSDYFDNTHDDVIRGREVKGTNISRSKLLTRGDKDYLIKLQRQVQSDPLFGDRFDKFRDLVKEASSRGDRFEYFGGPERKAKWERNAENDILTLFRAGASDKEINQHIEDNYSFSKITAAMAPPLVMPGTKAQVFPTNHEYIEEANALVQGSDATVAQKLLYADKADMWHDILVEQDIPRAKEDRAAKRAQENIDFIKGKAEAEVTTLNEQGLSEESVTALKSLGTTMNDIQLAETTKLFQEQDKHKAERAEAKRKETLENNIRIMENLKVDSDVAEISALEKAGPLTPLQSDVFLANYRMDRARQLQSSVVAARRRYRLAVKNGSQAEITNAEQMVISMENIQQDELDRQKRLGKVFKDDVKEIIDTK